ncbi:Homoserine/homoserine lactone efflux protein [Vibrio thalassae]|uniref:Homoserine/homoserine lactone efflux protein n=1 Tax=Vibrio thalassae TaxID=1243014 RepID=A0A240EKI1_9VIBR|nr:LysE family translocator [Vibrio thalassae]SNX49154.1 Homoserine/homoserine lactone efflux protein [Vibrio thalassae]
MTFDVWLVYLFSVVCLSLAPGPNGMLALSHGVVYGKRKVLATISGGVVGFILVIAMTMFGVGAVMLATSEALTILKWLGGAYLIYLGYKLWNSPSPSEVDIDKTTSTRKRGLFIQGFVAAVSNPKVLLFFGAFLPQFMNSTTPLVHQFVVIAATFAVVEFAVEYLIARLANKLRPWLAQHGKRFNKGCGSVFAVLGASFIAS